MKKFDFFVRPRYTCGSPSLVDETTARKVADEEHRGYLIAMSGRKGEGHRRMAAEMGLAGIVLRVKDNVDILEAA